MISQYVTLYLPTSLCLSGFLAKITLFGSPFTDPHLTSRVRHLSTLWLGVALLSVAELASRAFLSYTAYLSPVLQFLAFDPI